MNTDPQTQSDTLLDPKPEPSHLSVLAPSNSNQAALASPRSDATGSPPNAAITPFAYRGNGKVARLPKTIRDQINHWMLDGLSYSDIIQRLGPHGTDLNSGHLCEWRKRGHQDWLLQQDWLDQTRARQEPAAELSSDFDATQLNHAALQLGALQIFEALRDLASSPPPTGGDDFHVVPASNSPPESNPAIAAGDSGRAPAQTPNSKIQNSRPRSRLDLKLGGDSAAFVRLMNALARASRETMQLQKYREACAKARAALHDLKDPKRKLTDSERRAIVRNVDEILGLGSDEEEVEAEQTNPNGDSQELVPTVSN